MIANGKATIPNAHGLTVVNVGPNDVIQVDGDDRITGVRMADGSTVRFQPGTAFSPEGSPIVRGKLAEGERTVDLAPSDKIEMQGTLEDGDEIVLSARATKPGAVSIGFGECRGRIAPALVGRQAEIAA